MKGFTLIEVLVALAVFALIAASGAAMLRFTVDNQALVGGRMERLAQLERTRALMAADIGQAADRPARGLDGLSWPAFAVRAVEGDGVFLTLTRRGWDNPEEAPRASLRYVEYALVAGRLERRTRPMVDGAPLGPPTVLLDNIDAVSVDIAFAQGFAPVDGVYRGAPPRAVAITIRHPDYGPLRQAYLAGGQ